MKYEHIPVMLEEALEYLNIEKGKKYIDCTLGGGGYTQAISKLVGANGSVLSIDLDQAAIANTADKKLTNVTLAQDNFRNLKEVVNNNFSEDELFDGIVMDLGLSSYQLSDISRGFSFRSEDSVEMVFEKGQPRSTEYIINHYSQKNLEKIIREYGEERHARLIAKKIVSKRTDERITQASVLASIVANSIPKKFQNPKIHPATKTFQALRIETNQEIDSLKEVLPQAVSLLKKGGRLVVISFHSLEDKIVKEFMRHEAKECICPPRLPICNCKHIKRLKILTKKIIIPSLEELTLNPRSRSSKLRASERV